jgi:uncharacterized protein
MLQRHATRTVDLSGVEGSVVGVVSDTHSTPHPGLLPALKELHPSLILHAGDVGDPHLLTELKGISETVFVRGNVDPRGSTWPDSVTLHIQLDKGRRLNLLLLHFAVVHWKLNGTAWSLLQRNPAQIVIFGHSHLPFLGVDGKITLFNPGSAGPPRFGLPITLGLIKLSIQGVTFKHLDLQTGKTWSPR